MFSKVDEAFFSGVWDGGGFCVGQNEALEAETSRLQHLMALESGQREEKTHDLQERWAMLCWGWVDWGLGEWREWLEANRFEEFDPSYLEKGNVAGLLF